MPDDDVRAFYRLAATATRLELAATAPMPRDPEDVQAGVAGILATLRSDERERWERTLGKTAPPAADACFAANAMQDRHLRLELPLRRRFVRAVALAIAL